MDETGYNRETLEKLLQRMEQVLRILYDEGTKEVFLLHWAEGNWNKKTATLRALAADLKEIQSKTLKETVKTLLLKNGIFTEEEVEKAEKTAPSAQERNEKEQRGTTGNKRSGEGEDIYEQICRIFSFLEGIPEQEEQADRHGAMGQDARDGRAL